VNPQQAARQGLTEKTFEIEFQKNIMAYVDWYYATRPAYTRSGPIAEDAARQCALGNPAACNW